MKLLTKWTRFYSIFCGRHDVSHMVNPELCFCFHRYYFVVEEDNTPLSVTVTPCDAPLEWRLTLQELPEEGSGEGSGNYSQVLTVY